ncbi:MAG: hypothetical protein Q9167_000049 [Letrouitia subvulpina]
MQLRLPHGLHYPITVTELLKQPNDNVERFAPLFSYFYKTTVTEGDDRGDEWQIEKTFPTRFESSVEGVLKRWSINKGAVISRPGLEIAEIEEPCAHGVQFGGMCVNCGKDMTESTYITDQVDSARATINMVHDKTSLTVSQDEATKFEDEAKRRLLASRKLSLVVDLDQTVIQACVDPTIGEWKRDPSNPNHDAVKDVREFQLVEDASGARGCWYYIKLRPALEQFLESISKLYELHIYTMGTRGYAQKIAKIIDPERKFFGDRILSRDESGSLVAKNLQRLFPVDTKMVLIIDDRGDVWKWNDNLVKVTPYDFFVGIGDINSSFLPKKPGIVGSPRMTPASSTTDTSNHDSSSDTDEKLKPKVNGVHPVPAEGEEFISRELNKTMTNDTSALDQLVSMGGGDDPSTRQAQATHQVETLAAQLEDRPLLKKQLQLEEEDALAASASLKENEHDQEAMANGATAKSVEKPRHHLLQDHDIELHWLEKSLRKVHAEYFDTYARRLASKQGGRVAELRGSKRKQTMNDNSDLALVPDIKAIMPTLKNQVLSGVVIVMSGIVPLGWDVQSSDLAMWAKSFGARIEENVTRKTTHLVAARNRTAKVRHAIKGGKDRIHIVGPQWLINSLSRWTKLEETPYLLTVDDGDGDSGWNGTAEEEILSESEEVATDVESEEEVAEEPLSTEGLKEPKASMDSNIRDEDESDNEGLWPDDLTDQDSPVGGTNEDWDIMHAELNEFLGSEAEDSDGGDSVTSVGSARSARNTVLRGTKRVYESDESNQEGKRKKTEPRRKTNLGQSLVPIDSLDGSGTTAPAKENGVIDLPVDEKGAHIDGDHGSDDGWSEFEEDLEAELEKAAAEE